MRVYNKNYSGFTIVELLIVIVVIGILAAISVVSFRGVQEKARGGAAISLASQTAKQLEIQKTAEGIYPSDLSMAGVTNTSKIQYRTSNTPESSYCITVTEGNVSYFINSIASKTPSKGSCPGHGAGGVETITNLSLSPKGGYTTEWLPRYSQTRSVITNASDGPTPTLDQYLRSTQNTTMVGAGRGIDHSSNLESLTSTDRTWPILSGDTITASIYTRSSIANDSTFLTCGRYDNAGNIVSSNRTTSTYVKSTPNQWNRLSVTFTAQGDGLLACSTRYQDTTTWTAGSTIDFTGLMITKGANSYAYGDGNSPGWIWNGSPQASTSSGPAL